MTRRALPLFCLVLCLWTSLLAAADWPQWRGPDRTDISRETGLLDRWPEKGPRLLWTFRDAGVGFSAVAVVGDRLYSMGAVDGKEYVYVIDLKTQKKTWSAEVGPVKVDGRGDGPRGTPTVDGSLVYALGGRGNLVCVKADSGAQVWSKDLVGNLNGGMPGWGYSESPLVDGDQVVVTPGGARGTIAAFDKKTGELKQRSADFKDGAQYASLIVAEVAGIRQYIQMTGASVAGVAAQDGKLLWKYPRKGPTAAAPTPIFHDGYVYATSGYGAGCNLIKLAPKDGGVSFEEVYANKEMTNHHGGVILVGEHIYGWSDKGGWLCQNFKTGAKVWNKESRSDKGSVTCAEGLLYGYHQEKGDVVLFAASPAGYDERGRFRIPEETKLARKSGKIWTHPVVANSKLYLRDQDLIFCFDVSKAQ